MINFEILSQELLSQYKVDADFDLSEKLEIKFQDAIPFDFFNFYSSISSVYSSKIEGEQVDVDSYLKHKFLKVKYEPDYTKKADDLFAAYKFIDKKRLKKKNALKDHKILSRHLLAKSQQGIFRNNPMFVMNEDERIEYIACDPSIVKNEWDKLFRDIKRLLKVELDIQDVFYYASFIHLVFLKIHPLQDGNGRMGRLIEKWFLTEKLGQKATSIELEKNYYLKKQACYDNIRILGIDYESLNYSKAKAFLLMTIMSLK